MNKINCFKKINSNRAITLIALVVTIVILLILASVAINGLLGENGLITKTRWARFKNNYYTVLELKEINELNSNLMKKLGDVTEGDNIPLVPETEEIIYPVKTTKYELTDSKVEDTLKQTIKNMEGLETLSSSNVQLYEVDMQTLKLDLREKYVINIKSGELYQLNGFKYKGNTYHRPDLGVTKDGTVVEVEEPDDVERSIYRLKIGETKDLSDKVTLDSGEYKWTSSDTSVVEVDQTGKIYGIAKGEAKVTVAYKTEDTGDDEGGSSDDESAAGEATEIAKTSQEFTVIVESGIPESISLELEDCEIKEFETKQLEPKIDGKNVGLNYFEWQSSDESKVTIDTTGKVKGIAVGTSTITGIWKEDTTKTVTCTVTVAANNDLLLDKNEINIVVGQKVNISAKYNGTDVTSAAAKTSSDTSKATISSKTIEGKATGNANIDITYNGITKTCIVHVKDSPTEIYTIEDLNLFAAAVNNGNKYVGQTVKLMNNLDFKNASSYVSNTTTEYNNFYANTTSWTVIGLNTSKYFSGTFDGNGNTIKNLYISATAQDKGLFGYAKGGTTFKDLKLENVNISSTSYDVGALLGQGEDVNVSNITVTGTVSATGRISSSDNRTRIGGIVGCVGANNGNVTNCVNEATVTGKYNGAGGIVGDIYKGIISGCKNKGAVTCNLNQVGGIAGRQGDNGNSAYSVTIDNCKNYGVIQGKCVVGGISGCIYQNGYIKNSINYASGTVSASGYDNTTNYYSASGGICGGCSIIGGGNIEKCNNYAAISGTYRSVGGIVGACNYGTVKNCYNEGTVSGTRNICGGIAGTFGYYHNNNYREASIDNCINYGNVSGTSGIGGIAGQMIYTSQLLNSTNNGSITSTGRWSSTSGEFWYNRSATGGIVGNVSYTGSLNNKFVYNCINNGSVNSSYSSTGGIVGLAQKATVDKCTNNASVKSTYSCVGGIVGYAGRNDSTVKTYSIISNCINNSNVEITGTGVTAENAGGIAGLLTYGSLVTKCGNYGDVKTSGYCSSSDKTSRTGGIAGLLSSSGANKVTYCYNLGNVTGAYKYIGGIVGSAGTTTASIENSYSKGTITGPGNIGGIIGYNKGTVSYCGYLTGSVLATSGTLTDLGTAYSSEQIDEKINSIK